MRSVKIHVGIVNGWTSVLTNRIETAPVTTT